MPRAPIDRLLVAALLASAGCYQGAARSSGSDTDASSDASASASASAGDSDGSGGDAPPSAVAPEPLHRLNRLEYNNTVRDLLGVTLRPADAFPPDNATEGFDNLAEGLTLTPSQMDLYALAARELAEAALTIVPRLAAHVGARAHAEASGQAGTAFDWGWSMPRGGGGALNFTIEASADEAITASILAGGDALGVPTPEMGLVVDGVEVGHWIVSATPVEPAVYSVALPLAAGAHTFAITFPNGYDQPAENIYNSLVVGYLDVESEATVTPPGRTMIYVCDPDAAADPALCYRTIVTRLAQRAWRRPLADADADALSELWSGLAAGEGPEEALKLTLRAILLSSRFLYRPSLPGVAGEDTPPGLVPLDDYTLASRLSYFLWSSMPDDELFDAAAAGLLRDDDQLRAQVQRMLADPRADGLRAGFASQWLSTRHLALHQPDPATFPSFDEPLRAAMIEESERLFVDFLGNGRPIGEMMRPDFGYLNDRLAEHYGAAPPGSSELVRVDLGDDDRRGLMLLGAWQTATSASNRTSPVLRGRWILEQLLCIAMPAPPPDVPPLMPPAEGATIREVLEEHRQNPTCAGCHDLLDPAGLGMEGYDGVGVRRELEKGLPVDESGAIPDGLAFNGADELAALLAEDPRFVECLADKLFTYGLGRGPMAGDGAHRLALHDALAEAPASLDQLIEMIVLSPAFRTRSEGEE
ncbi:MAG: DUF1592 domain-containing protein [Myxococcales bacterium]|nr:DUF1592 domain-containing protein [Myxococcales bacterium]MCB9700973.1 DUF1592 domain-containing protein [Myxococcales bacterium]